MLTQTSALGGRAAVVCDHTKVCSPPKAFVAVQPIGLGAQIPGVRSERPCPRAKTAIATPKI